MRTYMLDRAGSIDDLRIIEAERPAAGEGRVLVRVRAAAMNPADVKVFHWQEGASFIHARTYPMRLGYDFSGVIEDLGPGVDGVAAGQDVFGFLPYSRKTSHGSFAEYVSVQAAEVAIKPAGITHAQAACAATAGCTALQALRDKGALAAGRRVLVNGASGGVGSYAVQIAKLMGAEVWGTCSAAKAGYVSSLGADKVIDYRATPIDALDQTFDVILDAASTSSFGRCSARLAGGGTYVTLLPSLALIGGFVRSLLTSKRCRFVAVASRRADLAQLATWMEEDTFIHPIDTTYAWDDLAEAFKRLQDGQVQGKIAIVMAE